MKSNISKTNIKSFKSTYNKTASNQIVRNALTQSNVLDVAMDWDAYRTTNHIYSHLVKDEISKVTNQKASGRCWGFGAIRKIRNSCRTKEKSCGSL